MLLIISLCDMVHMIVKFNMNNFKLIYDNFAESKTYTQINVILFMRWIVINTCYSSIIAKCNYFIFETRWYVLIN